MKTPAIFLLWLLLGWCVCTTGVLAATIDQCQTIKTLKIVVTNPGTGVNVDGANLIVNEGKSVSLGVEGTCSLKQVGGTPILGDFPFTFSSCGSTCLTPPNVWQLNPNIGAVSLSQVGTLTVGQVADGNSSTTLLASVKLAPNFSKTAQLTLKVKNLDYTGVTVTGSTSLSYQSALKYQAQANYTTVVGAVSGAYSESIATPSGGWSLNPSTAYATITSAGLLTNNNNSGADINLNANATHTIAGVTKSGSTPVLLARKPPIVTGVRVTSGATVVNEAVTGSNGYDYNVTVTYDNGETAQKSGSTSGLTWAVLNPNGSSTSKASFVSGKLTTTSVLAPTNIVIKATYSENGTMVSDTTGYTVTIQNDKKILNALTIFAKDSAGATLGNRIEENSTATFSTVATFDDASQTVAAATWLPIEMASTSQTGTAATSVASWVDTSGNFITKSILQDEDIVVKASYTYNDNGTDQIKAASFPLTVTNKSNQIRLVPQSGNVEPQTTVKVDVVIDFSAETTSGGGVDIAYNESLLEFVSFDFDPSFLGELQRKPEKTATGKLTGLAFGTFYDGLSANVATDGSVLPITVGRLTFKTVGVGSASLTLSENARPVDGFYARDSAAKQRVQYLSATVVIGNNIAPVAKAGSDQSVVELSTVTLNGNGSSDSDGQIVGYAWSQTAGPGVNLNNRTTAVANFTAPAVLTSAQLNFSLTVTDNSNATHTDSVMVVIRPTNERPVAYNKTYQLDRSLVVNSYLDVVDPNGNALTYSILSADTAGKLITARGVVNLTNKATGAFTYLPNAGMRVADSFSFIANDGVLDSNIATVTIHPPRDADGDGVYDFNDAYPNDPRYATDSDGDKIPDEWERLVGLNPSVKDDNADNEPDDLTNIEEFGYLTNPNSWDTDKDNVGDKEEINKGRNPTVNEPAIIAIISTLLLN